MGDKIELLEVIKVGNGTSDYPGNFTNKENEIIGRYMVGNTLHLFSGRSKIGNVRIDFGREEATHGGDVFLWLPTIENYFRTIIIDAPYNRKFADKYKKITPTSDQFIIFAQTKKTTDLFNHLIRMKPERIILKSWNYYIVKGYHLLKGFLCYAGGYRKPTLLLIMKKINTLD